MVIVVYSSKTGSTAKYAKEFSDNVGIDCFPVNDPLPSDRVIFFGWLKGNKIIGFDSVKSMDLAAVCIVGLDDSSRFSKDSIPALTDVLCPVFYLRGATSIDRLSFTDRLVFFIVRMKMRIQGINQFNRPVFDAMKYGGSFYDSSFLRPIYEFYQKSAPLKFDLAVQ